jgi:hypothetical protein
MVGRHGIIWHCIIEAQMREMKNGIKISEQVIKSSRFPNAFIIFVDDLTAVLEISSQSNEIQLIQQHFVRL